MKNEPFEIERTYNAPVEKVWQALTDNDQIKQWYFNFPEFRPEVGFEFQFEGKDKGITFLHLCKITEVIPGKKLAYTWRYRDYEGNSTVTFELFPEGDKTRVKLTHEGLETFANNSSDFSLESFSKGWTQIIGTNLKNFVEKA